MAISPTKARGRADCLALMASAMGKAVSQGFFVNFTREKSDKQMVNVNKLSAIARRVCNRINAWKANSAVPRIAVRGVRVSRMAKYMQSMVKGKNTATETLARCSRLFDGNAPDA